MQGLGLMNGNVIDMQKISEQIDKVIDDDEKKESARKAVQECVDEAVNDDECLAANIFARCGFEHVRGRFHQLVNDLRNLGQE
ncbi:PREDICTED: uncharacterized protein LOC108576963 [Habropoda laboriosa]|uniref:uncharacterized protein LOC108576963 n=1 Tax=Habropoda laboriosa TaxID=597456 RepID=UPI00083D23BC|nr:PREDICTED: uncharacterized protein LOC108576963 [Habropoda laboriosa]